MSLVSGLNTLCCVLYLFLSGEIEQVLISIDKSSGISFILGIACFIEAILFAYFTFEMTYECCDVLESNQTYVDQLKNLTGIPMYFGEGCRAWFGSDLWFWLLPTKPKLYVNYLERLYTEQYLFESKEPKELHEDDFDPTGKTRDLDYSLVYQDRRFFLMVILSVLAGVWILVWKEKILWFAQFTI